MNIRNVRARDRPFLMQKGVTCDSDTQRVTVVWNHCTTSITIIAEVPCYRKKRRNEEWLFSIQQ